MKNCKQYLVVKPTGAELIGADDDGGSWSREKVKREANEYGLPIRVQSRKKSYGPDLYVVMPDAGQINHVLWPAFYPKPGEAMSRIC